MELRRNNELIEFSKQINCPVVAIHGSYDPHPADGVKNPLSKAIKNFGFFLIEKCGHEPWIEKQAKDEFYNTLKKELLIVDS